MSSRPRKFFTKQAIEIILSGFLFVFFFQILHFTLTAFVAKVENNSIRFLNWRAEENLVVNNKDNREFTSRNYRSDSCPLEILMFLKLAYLL